jgi:HemY protein
MFRIILFLVAIGVAAAGAAWVAEQSGAVSLVWNGWRIETSLPVFAFGFAAVVVVCMLVWALLSGIWRMPGRVQASRHRRRAVRGRQAIARGLLAIGIGDTAAARKSAQLARRLAAHDPLTLLLDAQAAQLAGDGAGARQAFQTMTERDDTRLLGLRGLFIEAQRHDDAVNAETIPEAALKAAPKTGWASHAVLGFRCARGDWRGALTILDSNLAAGLIDKPTHKRHRAVLLTAQALELENSDRDRARDYVMEALKLAPSLVPAAALASKFFSETHQVRKAMRTIEIAWRAHPHPDLAEAYAHVRLGDSARERLGRMEALAAKVQGHPEGALAVARVAIEASEFAKARAALAGLLARPTQRVAMLMAELERAEHGDGGPSREWTARAVRAAPDPIWTADGYASRRWHPVSPVTGAIDAFRWAAPVAALPSESATVVEPSSAAAAALPPAREWPEAPSPATPDALPPPTVATPEQPVAHEAAAALAAHPRAADAGVSAPPALFRPRPGAASAVAPPVIPFVRAPDDPGVGDDDAKDEPIIADTAPQAGGWRGTVARWVR